MDLRSFHLFIAGGNATLAVLAFSWGMMDRGLFSAALAALGLWLALRKQS